MGIEPLGIFVAAIGIVSVFLGYRSAAIIFMTLAVLGAAATLIVGSSSIPPAHLFILFLAAATLSHRREAGLALRAMAFPRPAFWLAGLLLYGAATGLFAPRLLAGVTQIVPLGISEYNADGGTVPLGPVSSNLTQAVYLTADLISFCLLVAIGSTPKGFVALVIGLISYAAANIVFGLMDLLGGPVGRDLLGLIRNAQYTMRENDTVAGVKRVVGSWPEASAFAGTTLGSLGFCGTMWLCGRFSRWTGIAFVISLFLIIRSTSSTGLFAAPLCLALLYMTAVVRSGANWGSFNSSATLLLAPPIAAICLMMIALDETLTRQITDYVDLLIFSKANSSSGSERGAWNAYALANFVDSSGLGVGLGTARTSSFVMALLSNVGWPGTFLFVCFMIAAFGPAKHTPRSFFSDSRMAARNGCFCLLIGSLVAGPTVDLGLPFFILAALASCRPETAVDEASARVPSAQGA